jgi:hypothetical protein
MGWFALISLSAYDRHRTTTARRASRAHVLAPGYPESDFTQTQPASSVPNGFAWVPRRPTAPGGVVCDRAECTNNRHVLGDSLCGAP